MDIIFDIIDSILPDTILVLTIIFEEKYNISIGKDSTYTTLYFYDLDSCKIHKLRYLNIRKRKHFEHFLDKNLDNISILHIDGISSIENKELLSKYFLISDFEGDNGLINISKRFI